VRADFLAKLERFDEARAELQRALSMTKNAQEQRLLHNRIQSLPTGSGLDT
jgi:RNA polymerase sigma-70 factor (ECF subfamily)